MTEEYWQDHMKKENANRNLILNNVQKDMQRRTMHGSKGKLGHPKALYIECLKNNAYWMHYSASSKLDSKDVAMMVCKDIGCEINYCSQIKLSSLESEREPDRDCTPEINNFNTCMNMEQRRFQWTKDKPPVFDYIQNRIQEKKELAKYKLLLEQEQDQQEDAQPSQSLRDKIIEEKNSQLITS